MTDSLITIGAIVLMLLVVGGLIGAGQRGKFSFGWLLVAAGLVLINDALLTNVYHHVPRFILPRAEWNWQGKLLALAATLVIAALPAFGWKKVGLTLRQDRKGLRGAAVVALIVCAVFAYLALKTPNEPLDRETFAFQLTMPGLEEEPFYRGILLLALNEAFRAKTRFLGVQWGWGAILSCALFGLAHAFDYHHGAFSFDMMTMALTGGPALIAVWLRERTGSLALPILVHNFCNSISLLI